MQTTTNPKSLLSELSDNNNEPSWLLEKRQNALTLFQDTPMPSFIYGLNINLKIDLNLSDLDTSKSSEIKKEIINNNKEIKIYNLAEALENIPELLKEYFMNKIIPANDKFTSFHQAFVNNIQVIHIPKNTVAKDPIEITSIIKSQINFLTKSIMVLDDFL